MLDARQIAYACSGWGAPIQPEDFADPFDKMLEDILRIANKQFEILRRATSPIWQNRPFCITLTDGHRLNAAARKTDGVDLIILPVGVIEQLWGATSGLMAVPFVLPRIGDVYKEPGLPRLPNGFPRFPLLLKQFDGTASIQFAQARCNARRSFALYLLYVSLDFLIWHEMGHIFGGHLEHSSAMPGTFIEMSANGSRSVDSISIPRRIFECDADAFATHHASMVFFSKEMQDVATDSYEWKGVTKGRACATAFALGIEILFRLVLGAAPNARVDDDHYPHPNVRAGMCVSAAINSAAEAGLLTDREATRLVARVAAQVSRAWLEFTLPGSNVIFDPNKMTRAFHQLRSEYTHYQESLASKARMPSGWSDVL